MKKLLATTAMLAALGLAVPSFADTIAGRAWREGNESAPTTNVFAQLNNAGKTSMAFKTPVANDLIRITFNAECGVLGPPESWLSVTILVDGVQANPPSGTSFALCTATSTTAYSWVGAVRQSFALVPVAGLHNVQVLVNLNGGATNWWLGDSSIAVETQ